MKQFIIALHIFLLSIAMTCAQQVTRDEATKAALNTLMYEYQDDFTYRSVDTVFALERKGNTLLFEVHFSDNKIVLLSGHKSCVPVVGILEKQTPDFENGLLANIGLLPPGLRFFLNNYIEQVTVCFQNNTTSPHHEEWDELQIYDENRLNDNRNLVPPLISSKWGQDRSNDGYPNAYNYFTPTCPVYGHCPVGCVAVAMGQIMKKWNYPQLIPNTCRHYNWSVMLDTLISINNGNYYTQRDSIARFLLECGTKVNMNYCKGDCSENSSYTFNTYVPAALKDFGYSSTNVKYKSNYSQTVWDSLIQNDLNQGMPVYYSGSGSDGGHAFICDGYNYSGLYHFNWGWRGSCNGWFYLSDLTPGSYSFTNSQCAIFNIHPSSCWENIVFGCNRYFVYSNATYSAEETIQNNYHIFSVMHESFVTLKAGEEIVLTDGFFAGNGGVFVAKIEACEPDDGDGMNGLEDDAIGERALRGDASHGDAMNRVSTPDADGLRLHPNPANTTLTVESDSPVRAITIYDLTGRTMLTVENCPSPATVNVVSLPRGIYLLRAVTDEGVKTARFVKN